MKKKLNKIASVLAFIIGGMAAFAGLKVLLGNDPGYYVINWLPVYNYTMGFLTILVTAVLIWINHRFALHASIATFSLHGLIMIILQTAYHSVVAADSIRAMTIRLITWGIILALLVVQASLEKASNSAKPAASLQT